MDNETTNDKDDAEYSLSEKIQNPDDLVGGSFAIRFNEKEFYEVIDKITDGMKGNNLDLLFEYTKAKTSLKPKTPDSLRKYLKRKPGENNIINFLKVIYFSAAILKIPNPLAKTETIVVKEFNEKDKSISNMTIRQFYNEFSKMNRKKRERNPIKYAEIRFTFEYLIFFKFVSDFIKTRNFKDSLSAGAIFIQFIDIQNKYKSRYKIKHGLEYTLLKYKENIYKYYDINNFYMMLNSLATYLFMELSIIMLTLMIESNKKSNIDLVNDFKNELIYCNNNKNKELLAINITSLSEDIFNIYIENILSFDLDFDLSNIENYFYLNGKIPNINCKIFVNKDVIELYKPILHQITSGIQIFNVIKTFNSKELNHQNESGSEYIKLQTTLLLSRRNFHMIEILFITSMLMENVNIIDNQFYFNKIRVLYIDFKENYREYNMENKNKFITELCKIHMLCSQKYNY